MGLLSTGKSGDFPYCRVSASGVKDMWSESVGGNCAAVVCVIKPKMLLAKLFRAVEFRLAIGPDAAISGMRHRSALGKIARMTVIGIDAHKASHTMVAVDHQGRKLGEKTVPATSAGHSRAIRWARATYDCDDLIWAVEDVRTVTARLERDLMDTGAVVVRVPTYLMARVRGSHRVVGKSDPIDALAVARAVLQEPNLPYARHDPQSLACKLMADRRDSLVRQRSATMTRLQWRIHQLDPTRDIGQGKLVRRKHRDELLHWLTTKDGLLAEFSRDEVLELSQLSEKILVLERRMAAYVEDVAPSLLALSGCGVLMAAKIVGETADVTRFRSESAFARFAGVGPLPNWSGNTAGTMRSHRSGNRQMNTALHRIALVQIRRGGPGATYYQMRTEAGDQPSRARRCLKRHIARAVYRALITDRQGREDTVRVGMR